MAAGGSGCGSYVSAVTPQSGLSDFRLRLDIICGQKPRNDEAVFHVAQPAVLKWSQILDMLEQAGLPFERLPVGQWLSRVEASSDDLTANPSKKMLFLWQRTVSCLSFYDCMLISWSSVWKRSASSIA